MDKDKFIGFLLLGTLLIWFLSHKSKNKKDGNVVEIVNNDSKKNDNSSNMSIPQEIKNQEIESVIENESIRAVISNIGAMVKSVQLKEYYDYNGNNVTLLDQDSSSMSLVLQKGDKEIQMSDKIFDIVKSDTNSIELVHKNDDNTVITQTYQLHPHQTFVILNKCKVSGEHRYRANIRWNNHIKRQEHDLNDCRYKTSINYCDINDNVTTCNDKAQCQMLKWIAVKQKFFTVGLACDNYFGNGNMFLNTPTNNDYVKESNVDLSLNGNTSDTETFNLMYYFGPNIHEHLKNFNINFEKNIYWGIILVSWFNKYVINPVVQVLCNHNINPVLLILLLVLFIKLLLLPLFWKSYVSTFLMKKIEPQWKAISEKYKDDQQQLQYEQIKLFQKNGINPFMGCLPLLLSMPFYAAMYSFMSIEMYFRHKSFLWISDLSFYDSVYNLPFNIPFFGDHIGVLPILTTMATILYSFVNGKGKNDSKRMIIPILIIQIFFLGFMNNMSSALVLYFFISSIVGSVIQIIATKIIEKREFCTIKG